MPKIKKFFRVLPRLLIRKVRESLRSIGKRHPSENFYVIEMSGNAWVIWTPSGNVVLTTQAARTLSEKLLQLTEMHHGL